MTEGEENIIIKGVLLEAISRDFSEELSNNKEVSVSPRFKRQINGCRIGLFDCQYEYGWKLV